MYRPAPPQLVYVKSAEVALEPDEVPGFATERNSAATESAQSGVGQPPAKRTRIWAKTHPALTPYKRGHPQDERGQPDRGKVARRTLGHDLFRRDNITWCKRCYCYSVKLVRSLKEECLVAHGSSTKCPRTRSYLDQGRHPVTGVELSGETRRYAG